MAVAIMPAAYARSSLPGELAVLPLSAPRVSRDICVVGKRGRALSLAAKALVAEVRATLRA
jgi:DNA-binding transcriptional LysR family regulator